MIETILKRAFSLLLMLLLAVWPLPAVALPASNSATAATDSPLNAGELTAGKLFELHCAGCHIHGGNIVRRGKNLKLKTLQKNQMDSVEAIGQIIALGRGNMSAYQDRLTPDQIEILAAYVLEQAQQNWPS